MRPAYSYAAVVGRSNGEAWIKNISDCNTMKQLVSTYSGVILDRIAMQCKIVQEPVNIHELCVNFEKGICNYPSERCHYKHFICEQRDTCENVTCFLGHSTQRSCESKRGRRTADENFYRLKFSNVPSTMTEQAFGNHFRLTSTSTSFVPRLKFAEENDATDKIVVYLIDQIAENLLANRIEQWHHASLSETPANRIRYQLERNLDYYDWNDRPPVLNSSSRSGAESNASSTHAQRPDNCPWAPKSVTLTSSQPSLRSMSPRSERAASEHIVTTTADYVGVEKRHAVHSTRRGAPTDLDKRWIWTNEKLSRDRESVHGVYLLTYRDQPGRRAAIKIYRHGHEPQARHESGALAKLAGETTLSLPLREAKENENPLFEG